MVVVCGVRVAEDGGWDGGAGFGAALPCCVALLPVGAVAVARWC